MTIDQLKTALLEKPSYFKESYRTISDRFDVSINTVHRVFSDPKVIDAKREYNRRPHSLYTGQQPDQPRIVTKQQRAFIDSLSLKSSRLPSPYVGGSKDNVLIIGDTHVPFDRPGYLEFCRETQELFDCGTVVHIGDETDNCALSQYEKDPDGLSASSEYDIALKRMKDWYRVFPDVKVCIGNHTARPFRLARTIGIPARFIKSYEEIWEAPSGWQWADSWDIAGVHYTHGNGSSGSGASLKRAMQLRQPVVMGHLHKEAVIQYNVSARDAIYGLTVGCGIDDRAYAFYYAKDDPRKSIVSCAVVLDGGKLPILRLMPL